MDTIPSVELWLSGVQSRQCTPNGSVASEPPQLQGQGRKRKRSMSRDTMLDNISESAVLRTSELLSSTNRSQNDILLASLDSASPRIHYKQPDETFVPEYVSKLIKNLSKAGKSRVIAEQLKDRLKAATPSTFDCIDASQFNTSCETSLSELDTQWKSVKHIYDKAKTHYKSMADENAWVQIVRDILDIVKHYSNLGMLEVVNLQLQSVNSRYLSTCANSSKLISKKTDLAFCFTSHYAKVEELQSKVGHNDLSHMTGCYTSALPMACAIEVKNPSGNQVEALIQFAVWAAAGLAKVEELFGGATLLPLLGWTVVGHKWELYVSWKEDGDVVVCGPWAALNAGTGSYEEIFKLLKVISEVGNWLQNDYWTSLSDGIKMA